MKKNFTPKLFGLALTTALTLTTLTACGGGTTALRRHGRPGRRPTPAPESPAGSVGTVLLSVNPEIEMDYDEAGNVVALNGLNDDGKAVLASYTGYEGRACTAVVGELVDEINAGGYFDATIDGHEKNIVLKLERGSRIPATSSSTSWPRRSAWWWRPIRSAPRPWPWTMTTTTTPTPTRGTSTPRRRRTSSPPSWAGMISSSWRRTTTWTTGSTRWSLSWTAWSMSTRSTPSPARSRRWTRTTRTTTTPTTAPTATESPTTDGLRDYGPNADGVTDYDDTDYGPNADGVTDYDDTDYGPNADGVTDYDDTDYGPNADGVTDYDDTDYGPNADGVTDYDDTDYGPNADGVTDYDDTDYGPNADGVTDYDDTDYGPNADGVTDYDDTDYGPNDDGVTDYGAPTTETARRRRRLRTTEPLRLRHELKHQISPQEDLVLAGRLRRLFPHDAHAGADGSYRVTSLYFDTPYDAALREKLDGVDRREKFRLRYYGEIPPG